MNLEKFISTTMVLFVLAASLAGCGSTEVIEVSAPDPTSAQEGTPVEIPRQKQVDIPESDIETLLQAGIEATAEESDLWEISKITDTEVLMQLTRSRGSRGRPESESGEGPENMTPPVENAKQQHDMEKPERSGGNPPGNGEISEGGPERGERGGRQPGNVGGKSAALAIVISGTEGTTTVEEDIVTQIREAAEKLGFNVNSMELTEEQQSFIDVAEGFSAKMLVLIYV